MMPTFDRRATVTVDEVTAPGRYDSEDRFVPPQATTKTRRIGCSLRSRIQDAPFVSTEEHGWERVSRAFEVLARYTRDLLADARANIGNMLLTIDGEAYQVNEVAEAPEYGRQRVIRFTVELTPP